MLFYDEKKKFSETFVTLKVRQLALFYLDKFIEVRGRDRQINLYLPSALPYGYV